MVQFARKQSALCNLKDNNFVSCNFHDRNFLIHGNVVEARLNFRRS